MYLSLSLYLSLSSSLSFYWSGHISHHSDQMSQSSEVSKIALWRYSLNVIVIAFVFVFAFVFLLCFCWSGHVSSWPPSVLQDFGLVWKALNPIQSICQNSEWQVTKVGLELLKSGKCGNFSQVGDHLVKLQKKWDLGRPPPFFFFFIIPTFSRFFCGRRPSLIKTRDWQFLTFDSSPTPFLSKSGQPGVSGRLGRSSQPGESGQPGESCRPGRSGQPGGSGRLGQPEGSIWSSRSVISVWSVLSVWSLFACFYNLHNLRFA